jgi:hypothetical protein
MMSSMAVMGSFTMSNARWKVTCAGHGGRLSVGRAAAGECSDADWMYLEWTCQVNELSRALNVHAPVWLEHSKHHARHALSLEDLRNARHHTAHSAQQLS